MSREATPLMQQYREIKSRHQDAILLFRMGDFYDLFSRLHTGVHLSNVSAIAYGVEIVMRA
jgi:hypothetical protein